MTPAVLDRPAVDRLGGERLGDGRPTLEERLEVTLRALLGDGVADCPVCHARMTREDDGDRNGGACRGGCGSRLF